MSETTLRWARSVDMPTLRQKISEYEARASAMGDRDVHLIWPILGDLRLVLAERQTTCVAP